MVLILVGPAADRAQWVLDHAEPPDSGERDTATDTDTATGPSGDYTASFGIERVALSAGSFPMGSGAGDPTSYDGPLGFRLARSR